jgi:hypothetical protein
MHLRALRFSLTLLLVAACGDHDKDSDSTHGGGHESGSTDEPTSGGSAATSTATTGAAQDPPAAPTDVMASLLDGGVHLVWKDASDNEDNFVVERKADGDADFTTVIELPFDSVTYHDNGVSAGKNYTFRVVAVNPAGEGVSDEVMIMVP